ncbi:MAG: ABC transporter substrate-binding protein [Lachnospiraceae bacterium]|jgi:ABC-type transport system substrate-binding protein|nr:ABC transporter substrate-binding protein [Lachnospiraceae bacterium]
MRKKSLATILTLAMAMTLMAGCGDSAGSSVQSAATSTGTESTASAAATSASDTAETGTAAMDAAISNQAVPDDIESAHIAEFNIASVNDPTDMGPWAGNMGGASALINVVYQSLEIKELNKDPEPCLAKTVTQVDDYTYNVELFNYIKDSEGNAITTADVEYSYETALGLGKVPSVKMIDNLEIKDDYNFVIHFKDNAAIGDAEGFLTQFFIVSQKAYESEGNGMAQHPIGTGPYVLDKYVGGSEISFVENKDYWQTDKQYIARSSEQHTDKINFQIITEAMQRATAIESGSLDYGAVQLSDADRLKSEGYSVIPEPGNLTYMIFLNADSSSVLSGNEDLRNALLYGVDNTGISQLLTSTASVPVYDISNSNYPDYYKDYYESEDNYYQYNADKAQKLLASSGFDKSKTLKLICSSDETSTEVAQILKNYWEALGVTVEITSFQGNLMSDQAAVPSNWDIYLLQMASTDYAVNVWDKVLNAAKYNWGGAINFDMDTELQKKLTEVRSNDGHTEANVEAFHDYLVGKAYCKGIVQAVQYYGASSKVDPDHLIMSEQRIIRSNATIFKAQ